MTSKLVIAEINQISKRFTIRQDRSIKDRLINFRNSRQHKQDFWALKGVSTQLELGTSLGLIGHNGSGKSTLLKIIGGIIQPTSGEVLRRGRLAALLELGAGFHPDLTGRDNVYLNASILGLTRKETDRYFDAIVDFSGIEEFINTQVKFYSSGMYVRLAFSVAVHVNPDLLLVDEVLAVGDEPFQRKCLEKIAEFQREGRSIVLVSHAAAQVQSLCNRVIVLDHGEVLHDGDTAEGLAVLRAGFEASRRHLSSKDRTIDPAEGPVSLLGIVTTLESGDSGIPSLTIELEVQINDPDVHWGAGFSIVGSGGLTIYQFDTFGMAITLPRSRGVHVVRAVIPGLNLGEGEYSVDVGLGLVDGTSLAGGRDRGSFAVGRDNQGAGVVMFRPTITTVPRT